MRNPEHLIKINERIQKEKNDILFSDIFEEKL